MSVGSGFVVAQGYVVTNAHVVAGADARGVRVAGDRTGASSTPSRSCSIPSSISRCSTSPGCRRRRLFFARSDPGRGALGATLGYPGGGPLTILPAAVDRPVSGDRPRHLRHGTTSVARSLELRAAIERGDSGGPLVLENGTVGGVVFAEARTNPDVGYALSATEVATAITPSIGRTAAADTGACVGDH